MAMARWQGSIQDGAGNVVPGAMVEVRREGGGLIQLYSDRAGTTPIGNPFTADGDGFAFFHAPGGSYRITATSGSFERELRYVPVGLAGEADTAFPGFETAAATEIADIAGTLNTNGKLAGRAVWDSTNNRLMIASGPDADDAWYVCDGSASVTPA